MALFLRLLPIYKLHRAKGQEDKQESSKGTNKQTNAAPFATVLLWTERPRTCRGAGFFGKQSRLSLGLLERYTLQLRKNRWQRKLIVRPENQHQISSILDLIEMICASLSAYKDIRETLPEADNIPETIPHQQTEREEKHFIEKQTLERER